MARLALTRLASLVGILLGLSVVVFLLEAVVPADPVRAMVGASATPQIVEAKRHELGLDRPLPAQYAHFLSRAVRGDLSISLYTRRPVRTDIAAFLAARRLRMLPSGCGELLLIAANFLAKFCGSLRR